PSPRRRAPPASPTTRPSSPDDFDDFVRTVTRRAGESCDAHPPLPIIPSHVPRRGRDAGPRRLLMARAGTGPATSAQPIARTSTGYLLTARAGTGPAA